LAIFTALGAQPRHVRAFVGSETGVLALMGLGIGAIVGAALSIMLVNVLSGVFDPPPSVVAVPWTYLAAFAVTTVGGLALAAVATVRAVRRSASHLLGELRSSG
jgi:putative ABC transport system permease protein